METYEKKYKDALKWIESIYTELSHEIQMEAEAFFPELEESEDERIRKTFIRYVKDWQQGYCTWNSDKDFCDDAIAWLEKQGEHKTDFRERYNNIVKSEWFKETYEDKSVSADYNEESNVGNCEIDGLYCAKTILEKTLGKVEGYQTDDGILEHKSAIIAVTKLCEQNPTWNEEDESNFNIFIRILDYKTQYAQYEWLKSIKERVQYLNSWKPSDEQITAFEHFVRSVGESDFASPYDSNTKSIYSLLSDLKKLKGE